jgi:hypothetical protein
LRLRRLLRRRRMKAECHKRGRDHQSPVHEVLPHRDVRCFGGGTCIAPWLASSGGGKAPPHCVLRLASCLALATWTYSAKPERRPTGRRETRHSRASPANGIRRGDAPGDAICPWRRMTSND